MHPRLRLRFPLAVAAATAAALAVAGPAFAHIHTDPPSAATVKTVEKLRSVTAELAKLPKAERMAAEAQKYCAINSTGFLGSMGAPIKLMIEGKPVYLCCAGCTAKAQANPAAALAKAEELKHAGTKDDHDHADQK